MQEHIDSISPDALCACFADAEAGTGRPFPSRRGGVIDRPAVDGILPRLGDTAGVAWGQLFHDTSYSHLAEESPLLVSLPAGGGRLRGCWTETPSPWGFLWAGEAAFTLAQNHWRSLLTVVLPEQKLTHFRFYSPYVLRTLAASCTPRELAWLLGPLAYVFIPPAGPDAAAPERTTDWLRLTNPRLRAESPREIAETYRLIDKPWWHVTEAHVQAFSPTLEKVYRANLTQRLWERHAAQSLRVRRRYGSVEDFVEASLRDARAWGFRTREQEYRFLLLNLRHDLSDDPRPHVRYILEQAPYDPETALARLEQTLRMPR